MRLARLLAEASLLIPSRLQVGRAREVAKRCDLDPLMAELGGLAAQALVQDLERSGERPADFAFDGEIPRILKERVLRRLQGSKSFDDACLRALKGWG